TVIASNIQSALTSLLFTLIGLPLATVFLMLFPLSIVFSMLRYHLWNVDVVIRRSLLYTALTATLALVYYGIVLVTGAVRPYLFQSMVGQQLPEIATVVSTLATAALFVPLRRRLQNTIDRRFYRRRYDAAK